MGYKNRARSETTESEIRLSEALLVATMCIIGIPVDVHIRDGSVYSGTFHTASFDSNSGVVLKQARLTKKGKCNTNVANGSVIETLVILSGDVVQIVAKGVLFPADEVIGHMAGDVAEAAVTKLPSSEIARSNLKESKDSTFDKKKLNQNRQSGDDSLRGEQNHCNKKVEFPRANEIQSSSSISDSGPTKAKPVEEWQEKKMKLPNGVSCDPASAFIKPDDQCCGSPASAVTASSSLTTASDQVVDVASEPLCNLSATSSGTVSPKSSESNRSSKEFKLNPGAKIFCPSFSNPISSTPPAVPVVASMAYVPSNSPMVPVVAQPEAGISSFAPRSSVPSKFAPNNNFTAGNGGSARQFPQPIIGHMGRTQPLRYAGQYHAVQTGPPNVPPNSQAVMVGRMGQLVYVQPVPHDLVQSTAAISPVPARPLLTPHLIQYPKHQGATMGALQMCLPPPIAAGVQQPFTMTNHIPVLQPVIPTNHPIPVPGSNALFTTKFP